VRRVEFIYVMTDSDLRWLKLGYSRNPMQRLEDVSKGVPFAMTLHASVRGSRPFEEWCHTQLAKWRTRGEWYRYGPKCFATALTALADVGVRLGEDVTIHDTTRLGASSVGLTTYATSWQYKAS
jgi:hypothetical protein